VTQHELTIGKGVFEADSRGAGASRRVCAAGRRSVARAERVSFGVGASEILAVLGESGFGQAA
jgi:hypothetical protein